jgi:hypothetical protein
MRILILALCFPFMGQSQDITVATYRNLLSTKHDYAAGYIAGVAIEIKAANYNAYCVPGTVIWNPSTMANVVGKAMDVELKREEQEQKAIIDVNQLALAPFILKALSRGYPCP